MAVKTIKYDFIKPELTVEELSFALYNANRKLEQANKELMKSRQELTEVFVNISHDLRSPVTAIRNFLEYLLTLDLENQECNQTLNLMYGRVDYLERLINDVFLLASIDSSKDVLRFEKINIGMLLEDFFYQCETDKKYFDRRLFLKVPEYFPYLVKADTLLLVRALDNLFSNALKYSAKDCAITLSASVKEKDTVLICVTDTGFGIAKEHLDKIFNRTYMVADARTPGQRTGCGLGLAIAKSVIENHGGSIWCESVPGKGSSFNFTLPLIQKE